jgi:hypothetical protein
MTDRIPFLWTNDDITFGTAEPMQKQLDFLDRFGIAGVFFVIPHNTAPITEDVALMKIIEKARGKGHEFYQHGYIHTPFESGVPELWMLEFSREVAQDYDERRLEIEKQHTLEAMVHMIASGAAIWRDAFGEPSPGYRPGWGAFCTNLYRALDVLGFDWVSSRIPCPTSWLFNQGKFDEPMRFRESVPAAPVRMGEQLWEYPIAGDYAFTVPNEPDKIDAMVDLAMREYEHYRTTGAPMLMCSHWHGLERNGDSGYAIHKKLLPKLLDAGVEPMGLAELHRRTAG